MAHDHTVFIITLKVRVLNFLKKSRFLRVHFRGIKHLLPLSLLRFIGSTNEIVIMGNPIINEKDWAKKKYLELKKRKQWIPKYSQVEVDTGHNISYNELTSNSKLTVVVSIYRPGDLLSIFLGNIEAQTIFSQVDIILVLVDPLPAEIQILTSFCADYENIKLIVCEMRITIYQAWNIAINESKTTFLTNMNIDDLRSNDSLEAQLKFMVDRPWVDVGYQDFYYMRDRDLDWTSVKAIDASSKSPPVTLLELAWYGVNPPHNAPIWRRDLHERFGEFDDTLRSAGDYEFWMRVISQGGIFAKMFESTVGYFINPDGMSTSVNSPSAQEEVKLQDKYRSKIKLNSEILAGISVDSSYSSHPWDGAEILTEKVLDRLREVN